MPSEADAETKGQPESQAAERVVTILQVIGDSAKPLSVAEIAAELGLHRSIIYRFLRTLVRTRLVRQRDDGRYELGPGLMALASKVANDVQTLLRAPLQALADACEATAFVTELDDNATVCLISVEPVSALTHLIFKPGSIGPTDRGAAVMAIHAGMPPSAADYPDAVAARKLGYAWSTGQITPGIECVAAPIHLPTSSTPASVAVIYPVGSRVVSSVAAEVLSAASRINTMFDSGP